MDTQAAAHKVAMTPLVLVMTFIVLIGVSAGLIETMQRVQRAYIADHLQANLKSTVDYIQLVEQEQIAQVGVIASNKTFMRLAAATLAHPSGMAEKAALEEWLAGIYPNSELRSYALVALDGIIRASTMRDLEGGPPPQRQEFQDLLNQLQRVDVAVTPLIDVITPSPIAPVGALFQVICSNIRPGDNSIGYFCLLSPASSRLFEVLKVVRTGKTGEAYLIDTNARIQSPSRFITLPDQARALRARVPISSQKIAVSVNGINSNAAHGIDNSVSVREGALTEVAKVLLEGRRKQTGYLENYRDYRGVPVVGVGQWLDELGVGVIVEEASSEAFYVYRVSSWAIAALTSLAIVLMVFLVFLQRRAQNVLQDMNHELEVRVDTRTRELMLARDNAEAGARAKTEFLANMSHEIRTPLNAVLGMAHLAQLRNTDEQIAEYLKRIDASGQHLLGVVNSILNFSKLEAGKFTVVREEFSLSRVLEQCAGLLAEQAAAKGLELSEHIDPDIPDVLIGDAQHIAQILINFIGNAVKFTERGAIKIRVTRIVNDGTAVRLRFSVQDAGVGIAETQLARLFQPFEQLDMSTTRQIGGTGLGLAICSRLARLLGGTVGVESTPGKGSTFFVELPLGLVPADLSTASTRQLSGSSEQQSHAALAASVLDQPIFSGRRVLLVEDNPVNREVGVAFLKLLGLSFATANNGAQALELLSSNSFDLVLMDLHMPVMDGLQATIAIRQNAAYAQLPIIALTADVISANLEKLKAAGVNDILGKPIQPDALRQVLSKWLLRKDTEFSGEKFTSSP